MLKINRIWQQGNTDNQEKQPEIPGYFDFLPVNSPCSVVFFLPLLELCELDEKFLAEVFVAEKLDGPLVDGASAVDEPGLVTYSILFC